MYISQKLRFTALLLLLGILSACAQGAKLSEVSSLDLSVIPEGKGRVFVYRKAEHVGSPIQPTVNVNGKGTRTCQPGAVFIVELREGSHTFKVTTEADSELTLDVVAGKNTYIECDVGLGLLVWRVNLVKKRPRHARIAIRDLVYQGIYAP